MRASTALLLISAQVAVFWLAATQANFLAAEVGTLKDRLGATELARHEARLQLECDSALWPQIPEHCLQRVTSRQ